MVPCAICSSPFGNLFHLAVVQLSLHNCSVLILRLLSSQFIIPDWITVFTFSYKVNSCWNHCVDTKDICLMNVIIHRPLRMCIWLCSIASESYYRKSKHKYTGSLQQQIHCLKSGYIPSLLLFAKLRRKQSPVYLQCLQSLARWQGFQATPETKHL